MRKRLLAVGDTRHAEACRHLDRLAAGNEVERAQLIAQHLRELPPAIQRRLAHQHGEAVAGDARGEHSRRKRPADHLGDAHDHLISHVQTEVLVEHVQAVDVGVDDAGLACASVRIAAWTRFSNAGRVRSPVAAS